MNQFKDGKKHGYWEEISKDGHLNKVNYIDGNQYGLVETFYPNGQLKCKFNVQNEKIDRFFLEYYENGQLKNEWNLKNGKFHGSHKRYFESGQLESSKIFKDHEAHGLSTEYFENGILKSKINWSL